MFPVLTGDETHCVSAYGKSRAVKAGELLVEQGERSMHFFLVVSGHLEITQTSGLHHESIVVHDPGEFFGDIRTLSGRRSVVKAQMLDDGEVIELDREQLQKRVETDSRLSEILVRAFILRRLELISHGFGDVVLVGSAYSAGLAAIFLSQTARQVHMLVRSNQLADTIYRYLIGRVEETPSITLRTNTQILALEGHRGLKCVCWRNNRTGEEESPNVCHVFLMTGSDPKTEWLRDCLALDAKGFIPTGPDLGEDRLSKFHWPLSRRAYLLEASLQGIFAVGDVRANNVLRVGSAVGQRSISISLIHKALQD
jgi:CRP-like cAMP-binding protein